MTIKRRSTQIQSSIVDLLPYFSSWLNTLKSREYLLHFSEKHWESVAKLTLLLGLSCLEGVGFNLTQIKLSDIEETHARFVTCTAACARKKKSLAYEIIYPSNRDSTGSKTSKKTRHKRDPLFCWNLRYIQEAKTTPHQGPRIAIGKPQRRCQFKQRRALKPGTRVPGRPHPELPLWPIYLQLRSFLLHFSESEWSSLLKTVFLLGIEFITFLGHPLHLLDQEILTLLVVEYSQLSSFTSVKNKQAPSLHFIDSQLTSNPLVSLKPAGSIEPEAVPFLRQCQSHFPLQWFTLNWMYRKNHKALQIYPEWWTVVCDEPSQHFINCTRVAKVQSSPKKCEPCDSLQASQLQNRSSRRKTKPKERSMVPKPRPQLGRQRHDPIHIVSSYISSPSKTCLLQSQIPRSKINIDPCPSSPLPLSATLTQSLRLDGSMASSVVLPSHSTGTSHSLNLCIEDDKGFVDRQQASPRDLAWSYSSNSAELASPSGLTENSSSHASLGSASELWRTSLRQPIDVFKQRRAPAKGLEQVEAESPLALAKNEHPKNKTGYEDLAPFPHPFDDWPFALQNRSSQYRDGRPLHLCVHVKR